MRMVARPVQGFCPACGSRGLTLGDGGRIRCSVYGCRRPDALASIIDDGEIHHLVTFHADSFTIKHPLIERLDNALMRCTLHSELALLTGPPGPATAAGSTWRVIRSSDERPMPRWERVS
jgi:hypothetical protein